MTLPGEVFVEIGWKVRDAVAAAPGVSPADVVVGAYANGGVWATSPRRERSRRAGTR